MKKANTLKRKPNKKKHTMKRKYTKKRRYTKRRKYTKKIQRGGVCPCAIPMTTVATSYIATALGSLGLYSLSKKET
jgi:hypothetical protein